MAKNPFGLSLVGSHELPKCLPQLLERGMRQSLSQTGVYDHSTYLPDSSGDRQLAQYLLRHKKSVIEVGICKFTTDGEHLGICRPLITSNLVTFVACTLIC